MKSCKIVFSNFKLFEKCDKNIVCNSEGEFALFLLGEGKLINVLTNFSIKSRNSSVILCFCFCWLMRMSLTGDNNKFTDQVLTIKKDTKESTVEGIAMYSRKKNVGYFLNAARLASHFWVKRRFNEANKLNPFSLATL